MLLNGQSLEGKAALPKFDRTAVTENTKSAPEWLHFGAGNIFRAFPAADLQKLLDANEVRTGIIAAEGFDYEIIDRVLTPHDNLSLLVTLKSDGTTEKTVIGSIVESLKVGRDYPDDWRRLEEIFAAPSLQMASFTITEKGYTVTDPDPGSYMGRLTSLLLTRYKSGAKPLALVSMDNCSQNGTKLFEAVRTFAEIWTENGLADKGFLEYVEDPARLSFPWTMVDKITPRPDEGVARMLENEGFDGIELIVTGKNTYAAPFVNAEEAQYLVIEDSFPNGRPPLEKAGVFFTDRATVEKVEKMKVCTCLNPLHTALAVFGCLLGYNKISDEMQDADLLNLIRGVAAEGLEVVTDPGILNPRDFIEEVLTVRFPNPFMPDTPQRIACDTSQKIPIRFGETIKEYAASAKLDAASLTFIPLVLAGWCRYLLGIDDTGNNFECSPDPMLEQLQQTLSGISIGGNACGTSTDNGDKLRTILSDPGLFGVDLYSVGLGAKVSALFGEMLAGKGAVRAVLQRCLTPTAYNLQN